MKKFISSLSALALACGAVAAKAQQGGNPNLDPECHENGIWIQDNFSMGGVNNYRYCELPAHIAVDGKIALPKMAPGFPPKPILWVLPQVVTVGNGHVQGADPATVDKTIIEIQAGANIAGAVQNSALVMTRGTTLLAYGSANDPIIFSSLDDDFSGKGEWGGVILSDFGVSNECNSGVDSCVMEGISQGNFYYGGDGNNTSPSYMEYVVITEGGSVVDVDTDGDPDPNSNSGDEINGLTLYAVDTQTTLRNIHIHDNLDDGIQFFGGNVDAHRLWLTCNQDDSVEWDNGYQGNITNLQIVQQDGADHAFELGNNAASLSAAPVSYGAITNASLFLRGSFSTSDSPFRLKTGTSGFVNNVIIDGYDVVMCSVPGTIHSVSFGPDISYDCLPAPGGPLPVSNFTTGFTQPSFWTSAQGNPGCN